MSSGHFSRTNRNQPTKGLNKSQQTSQMSTNPSQISNKLQQSNTSTGYVYKPPSKLSRTNVANIITTPVKQEVKVQQKQKIEPNKIMGFVKKPLLITQSPQKAKVQQPQVQQKQAQQVVKPSTVVNKPVSRLTNKNATDLLGFPIVAKKQQPLVTTNNSPTRPSLSSNIETKKQTPKPTLNQNNSTSALKRGLMDQLNNLANTAKSTPALDLKPKPVNPYSYPKKITPRDSQKFVKEDIINKQVLQRQQTPKFNRTMVRNEGKQEQKPVDVGKTGGYSYQRKVVDQTSSTVKSSQSASSLKQPISLTTAPVSQKVQPKSNQPINQSPVVQQAPIKSTLSHAARYTSKIQPIQPVIKQQPQIIQKQQQSQKKQIKRSSLIVFALQKLFLSKSLSTWNHLMFYTKNIQQLKKNDRIYQSFGRSLNKFIKNYENQSLMRTSFTLIKSLYSKIMKGELAKAIDPKMSSVLVTNRNNCFGRILENILGSDSSLIRCAFNNLKNLLKSNKQKQSAINYSARILGNLQSKKLRQHFSALSQFSKLKSQSTHWLLGRLSIVNQNYKKYILRESFIRISLNKLKQQASSLKSTPISCAPSKSVLTTKKQPEPIQQQQQEQQQPQIIKQIKQKIQQQQQKLSELKEKSSQQPSQQQLRQQSKQLKQDKLRYTNQNKQKKQINAQYKESLQSLIKANSKNRNEELQSLSGAGDKAQKEQSSSTLSLLHEIYLKLYKMAQEQCVGQQNINSLWTIHRVEQNKSSREIVAKWIALKQNVELKHQINMYEGNYTTKDAANGNAVNANSAALKKRQLYQKLQEQNEIVKKFIRSYIKQRYMWQEVKEYVAAVINQ